MQNYQPSLLIGEIMTKYYLLSILASAMIISSGGTLSLRAQSEILSLQDAEKALQEAEKLLKEARDHMHSLSDLFLWDVSIGNPDPCVEPKNMPNSSSIRDDGIYITIRRYILSNRLNCLINYKGNKPINFESVVIKIGDKEFSVTGEYRFDKKSKIETLSIATEITYRFLRFIAEGITENKIQITLIGKNNNFNFTLDEKTLSGISNTVELCDTSDLIVSTVKRVEDAKFILLQHEMIPYQTAGKSSIKGQAFLKTAGGEVRYGAGSEVFLLPLTIVTKDWYNLATGIHGDPTFLQAQKRLKESKQLAGLPPEMPKVSQILKQFQKSTIADGNGNFEFIGLPSGEYIVSCNIFWLVGKIFTGGPIFQIVKIEDGESKNLVLTQ
jgi:hypothetical protein